MSDIDPYAPVEADPKVVAKNADAKMSEPTVETVVAPVVDEIVVPEGSVKKILDWVGDDAVRAQKALDAENDGEKRSSLVSKLEAITK